MQIKTIRDAKVLYAPIFAAREAKNKITDKVLEMTPYVEQKVLGAIDNQITFGCVRSLIYNFEILAMQSKLDKSLMDEFTKQLTYNVMTRLTIRGFIARRLSDTELFIGGWTE